MNLILAYDAETTGLPDFRGRSDAPHQPHLVQLAACLADKDTRHILQSFNVIIQPDGWDIPTEVSDIHGITMQIANDVGIPETTAVQMLVDLWDDRLRIGHNESFDARIIRIALKRYKSHITLSGYKSLLLPDRWSAGSAECTARLSTSIVNLPPTAKMKAAGRHNPKTPKLTEAYEYFFGEPLENAHSAMADVRACLDVYWKIQEA